MQTVSFTVDRLKLDGNLFLPKKMRPKNPAILFFHGWSSQKDRYSPFAEALVSHGYICLTVSLRGHGNSEGNIKKSTRADFLRDAFAAYDYLVQIDQVDRENISLVGASFGAYMAALVTKERTVANLVLRVPANYPNSGFDDPQYLFSSEVDRGIYLQSQSQLHGGTLALNALQEFRGNILIVESENDTIIPHDMVEDYINAVTDKSKLQYIMMSGASHPLNDEYRKIFEKILVDWFTDKI